jgi:hypothetical protein
MGQKLIAGEAIDIARWFENFVRRSFANDWVYDEEWLIWYGSSLMRRERAVEIVTRVQGEYA